MDSLIQIPDNVTVTVKVDAQTAITIATAIFVAIVLALLVGAMIKKL